MSVLDTSSNINIRFQLNAVDNHAANLAKSHVCEAQHYQCMNWRWRNKPAILILHMYFTACSLIKSPKEVKYIIMNAWKVGATIGIATSPPLGIFPH